MKNEIYCLMEKVRIVINWIKNSKKIFVFRELTVSQRGFVRDGSIVLAEYTTKKVLAVESDRDNYKLLQKTLSLNKSKNKIDTLLIVLPRSL